MIRFVLISALLAVTGCMTTGGTAKLQKTDGTVYEVGQRNIAFAGGKAKAAEQQFVAIYRLPDGTDVEVRMGNGVEQPASPNVIQELTSLLQVLGPFIVPPLAAVPDFVPAPAPEQPP